MESQRTTYLLAIDQGTSSNRAFIFDNQGRVISSEQMEFPQYFPADGWVEHDAEQIWDTLLSVCRHALLKANLMAQDITACGITNQRETTVLWDKTTGAVIHPAIVWQDRRTHAICKELQTAGYADLVQQKTGLLLDPYFSASKLHWLLQHVPSARQLADQGKLAFGTMDSFLLWRLTGVHATDITNASRTLLFNIHTQEWDEELLSVFAIPSNILPEVVDCAGQLGVIQSQHLGAEIPVTGMAGDQQAALIGQACFKPGMLKATYGTGGFLMLNTGSEVVQSNNRLLSTVAYRINKQICYALEGSIFNAGTTIKWLRDNLRVIKTAAETEDLAQQLPDNGGVYFVPSFTGLGAPYWNPHARAAVFGLTRDSSTQHLARAALESVVYQTIDVLRCMENDCQHPITQLRVDGGMTVNRWLLQFLADLTAKTVQVPALTEITTWGVALLAGLGSGVFESYEQATWQCCQQYHTNISHEIRADHYKNWQAAVSRVNQ